MLALRPARPALWSWLAVGIAATLAVPIAVVLSALAAPSRDIWLHLWRTQLLELIAHTVWLLVGVGAGTLIVGGGLAWLVVHHRFPGRSALEWALILPLAVPAYVIGFAFLGLFEYSGPLQTGLRGWWGPGARLPELRSLGGVALMMTLVFYPYVYLLARVAFREQGTAVVETARSLGRSRWGAFLRVTVPMARPSLAAGVALAMMEALADFGTVAIFGYRTLTEAIYRVWYGMFDRIAATQLASVLLLFALALLLLERRARGRARFTQAARGTATVEPRALHGWRAAAATACCGVVLFLAFLLPVGQLGWWAVAVIRAGRIAPDFAALLGRTGLLAASAAVVVCALAVLLAYAGRLDGGGSVRLATQLASMGYAVPGAVIAVGVLLPLAWADHALVPPLERALGRPLGLLLTGSAAGLIVAYVVRFLAVGLQTVEASLGKISPALDDAARMLGARAGAALRRVHLPLMRGGVLTAAALVFVETMKEMPATLLLRPIGLNTLSVEIWERTSEAMWQEAAVPALTLVGAGLLPVMLLIRLTSRR
ncbi:MAG TPA: iron ABC transporter permease [Methylomirabilota bacterium]|jgi:iron(III) transport system permease protein|nr:iron ABC transporter permease [Methylomirabilota bacterium]